VVDAIFDKDASWSIGCADDGAGDHFTPDQQPRDVASTDDVEAE